MKKILISWSLVAIATLGVAWPTGWCPPIDLGYTVLLADDRCCNLFYSCSNGVPILMCCPDGLYFNDELDACGWPRDVACIPYMGNKEGDCDCKKAPGGSGAKSYSFD